MNPLGGNDPSMEDASSDAEVIARAARQPDVFAIVFDRRFATIHRYLERRVGRDAADELAAEIFRIAFEQRSRFRPLHASALPWLYGLATNLALKRWRGDARRLRALARLERWWRGSRVRIQGHQRVHGPLGGGEARRRRGR
jgi:DNA-directed RNA polymerase specialized sigma24 family protein